MIFNQPQIKFNILRTNEDNTDMTFVLSGLLPGIGQALGNFIRIASYSYMAGYAPTAYMLSGVDFELDSSSKYTKPVGAITENISNILVTTNNLSLNNFRLIYQNTLKGTIRLKDLSAVDLQGNPVTVEYINPDLEILTTSGDENVKLDILIQLGVGYYGSEDEVVGNIPVVDSFIKSAVRLDVDYNPVKRVNYEVLEDRPVNGQETLLLSIRTDGTFKSNYVLMFITNIILKNLAPLARIANVNWDNLKVTLDEEEMISDKLKSELGLGEKTNVDNDLLWDKNNQEKRISKISNDGGIDNRPVEELELTAKSYNWLKENNLQCIRDLKTYDDKIGENVYPDDVVEDLIRALTKIGLNNVIKVR